MNAVLAALVLTSLIPTTVTLAGTLRTKAETFHRHYDFSLRNGEIWFSSNSTTTEKYWMHLPGPKQIDGRIKEISADGKYLIALGADRKVYELLNAIDFPGTLAQKPKWTSQWGPPFGAGPGVKIPEDAVAWDLSVQSAEEDGFYLDSHGTKTGIGGGITTIYVLRDGGQRITYLDPWLPPDESYEVCGPHRGRFQSINLSTSGSTLFLINKYGDMYTRRYDFDMSGANWSYFKYSYDNFDKKPNPGLREKSLPVEDWKQQPKISGYITGAITIYNHGWGGNGRTLRVPGIDGAGKTGYHEKEIDDGNWTFIPTGERLVGSLLDNRPDDSSALTFGPTDEDTYRGLINDDNYDQYATWYTELMQFNPYCSPSRLRLLPGLDGEPLELILHTTETLRQFVRPHGATKNNPFPLNGMIEILKGQKLSPAVQDFVDKQLGKETFSPCRVKVKIDSVEITLKGGLKIKVRRS